MYRGLSVCRGGSVTNMNIIKKITDSIFKKADNENERAYAEMMRSMFLPAYSFNRLCSLNINSKITVDVVNSNVVDILFNPYIPIVAFIDYEAYSENRKAFIKPALYLNDLAVDLYTDEELIAYVEHCLYYPNNGSTLPMMDMSDEEFSADEHAFELDKTYKRNMLSYLSKTIKCIRDKQRELHLQKRIEKIKVLHHDNYS